MIFAKPKYDRRGETGQAYLGEVNIIG